MKILALGETLNELDEEQFLQQSCPAVFLANSRQAAHAMELAGIVYDGEGSLGMQREPYRQSCCVSSLQIPTSDKESHPVFVFHDVFFIRVVECVEDVVGSFRVRVLTGEDNERCFLVKFRCCELGLVHVCSQGDWHSHHADFFVGPLVEAFTSQHGELARGGLECLSQLCVDVGQLVAFFVLEVGEFHGVSVYLFHLKTDGGLFCFGRHLIDEGLHHVPLYKDERPVEIIFQSPYTQDQLSQLEDEIQMSRRYYNGTARDQNNNVLQFPGNIIAGMFGFARLDYFELTDESEAAVPEVKF